jgi:hypothetical protein
MIHEFYDEYIKIINKCYVNNGEYEFNSKDKAVEFAEDLLWRLDDEYNREYYWRTYNDFEDFLYSSDADRVAYYLYEDDYAN